MAFRLVRESENFVCPIAGWGDAKKGGGRRLHVSLQGAEERLLKTFVLVIARRKSVLQFARQPNAAWARDLVHAPQVVHPSYRGRYQFRGILPRDLPTFRRRFERLKKLTPDAFGIFGRTTRL